MVFCLQIRTQRLAVALCLWLVPALILAERLPVKTYTTADGLPKDQINRIVQDSRGFMWFATSDGLARFDGYQFTSYGVEQGLISSFPIRSDGEKLDIVPGLPINAFSRAKIDASANELKEEKALVAELLPRP